MEVPVQAVQEENDHNLNRKLKFNKECELALTHGDCLQKTETAYFFDDHRSCENMKEDVWILDSSGVSAHVPYSKGGMINLKQIDKKIKLGDEKYTEATYIDTKVGASYLNFCVCFD